MCAREEQTITESFFLNEQRLFKIAKILSRGVANPPPRPLPRFTRKG